MKMENYLLMLCIAGMIGGVVYTLSRLLLGDSDYKLRARLGNSRATGESESSAASGGNPVVPVLQKIGQMAARPFMPKSREKQSGLRRDLARAGIYSPAAIRVVTGAKLILLFVGLGGGYLMGLLIENMLLGVPVGGLIGYCLPKIWLKMRISGNQRALTNGLPDALDLMVVCVESGLTVEAAMQRVGQEVGLAHPGLSRELGIAHMETRVGLSRAEALRNLGQRTANPAVQSLSTMLVQAERFGTSIASALRVHAESLRNRRQNAAEEMAAKASVKLSFPLVLFIFPATFIVLGGPAVISVMKSALFE
jgi:tight adherence protein C